MSGARCMHVDLAGASASWVIEGRGPVHLVFWWRSVPLGRVWLDDADLPLGPRQVAECASSAIAPAVAEWLRHRPTDQRVPDTPTPATPDSANPARAAAWPPIPDRPLLALDRCAAPSGLGRRLSLRVVICTRERPDAVAACVRALVASREPAEEIVVVASAPASDVARGAVSAYPGVRYVVESRPGMGRARNSGTRDASTDLVAFADEDVVVHADWTARVRDAFASQDVAAMTGLTLPVSLDEASEVFYERYVTEWSESYRPVTGEEALRAAAAGKGAPVLRIGVSGNLALRRTAMGPAGPFDERLGAGASGGAEGAELWSRLLRAGQRCLYEPRAVVFHAHPRSMGALRGRVHGSARGQAVARLVRFDQSGDWGDLPGLVRDLSFQGTGRLIARLTQVRNSTPSFWSDEVSGTLSGIGYYLRHRRAPRFTTP